MIEIKGKIEKSSVTNESPTRVFVIGHNYMTRLNIARALGKAGFEVHVICVYSKEKKMEPDRYCKYVSGYYYTRKDKQDELLDLLLTLKDEQRKALLFPCSDFASVAVDNLRDELAPYYYASGCSVKGDIMKWMDKNNQKRLADELGILNAHSWNVEIKNGSAEEIPADIIYPCFPKASFSISGGKVGMTRCDNEQQLRQSLTNLDKRGCTLAIVEQYLTIDKEYALIGFSDGKNVIIPGVVYLRHISKKHFGVAISGELLPASEFNDILEQYKSFVRETGFVGLFDIDFFDCQGKYYFGEMNMRVGASCEAYIQVGINMPVMMVNHFLGKTINSENITSPSKFINERMAVDDWFDGWMDTKQMLQYVKSGKGFIYDESDIIPYQRFLKDVRIKRIKKFIKELIRK